MIEIITGRERRRRWGVTEQLRIVAESQESGARVCDVAARHDVSPSLLRGWRRLARDGRLARMIAPPSNVHVWLACGHTDLRRGFDGLASLAQNHLGKDPFSGQLLVFRGRRGDLIKALWWDGQGLCLFARRFEKGRFVWPQAKDGAVFLTPAQLSTLLEGIDWRAPARTWRPDLAG
jgi:transposase